MKHPCLLFLLAPTALLSSLIPSSCLGLDLLVGNTRGNVPISQYNDGVLSPFLPEGIELIAPDNMLIDNGYLYIAQGNTTNTSSIFRMNLDDGSYEENFVEPGDDLFRPYGFAINDGTIYVASFLSDQILMYSEETGEFMGEFAMGDGTEEGLCNGPNQIAIHDGKLYLTTEGTVAVDGVPQFGLASQIVVYDLETAEGSVYIPQPELLEGSLGYVSMLGIMIGCGNQSAVEDDCTVYTTDFGGGLRAYALESAELIYASGTTVDGASTGSLTMTDDMTIVIPIFTDDTSGSLLQFDAKTGEPMGMTDGTAVLVGPTSDLARPIGILFLEMEVSPPVMGDDDDDDDDGDNGAISTSSPTAAPATAGTSSRIASVLNAVAIVVVSFVLLSV